MQELIADSQGQLHDVFTRTYGVLYERNSQLFRKYFLDLKMYYLKGNISLQEKTMSFFTTLYKKMFEVSWLFNAKLARCFAIISKLFISVDVMVRPKIFRNVNLYYYEQHP